MYSYFFNVYMDGAIKEVKIGVGRIVMRFSREGGGMEITGLIVCR